MADTDTEAAADKAAVETETAGGQEMPPTYDEANPLTGGEDTNVKIQEKQETKIDIGKESGKEKEAFEGLTKEELMKYANDPYWVRLRWALFILFWIIWVAMLVSSIVIIIYAPKCPSPEPKEWWQKNAMVKVDVKTYSDGKLAGLQDKLDLFAESGVGTLYISSLFQAPTSGSRAFLTDYKTVDSQLGSMDDWKAFVSALKDRDQKVVIDFLTNAASYQDLDLGNSEVVQELEQVMRFWLDTGVNGFVVEVGEESGVLAGFRRLLDAATEETGVPCVLMTAPAPALGLDQVVALYGEEEAGLAQLPLYTGPVAAPASAAALETSLDTYLAQLPAGAWPSLGWSSLTAGPGLVDAMTMLKMMLPGTPLFSTEEVFLQDSQTSHLEIFSTLASKMRHQDSILFGELTQNTTFVRDNVFGLTRVKKGNPGYLLLINFGDAEAEVDVSEAKFVPEAIRLMTRSVEAGEAGPAEEAEVKRFESTSVLVKPSEGRVFTFVPKYD